MKSFLATGAVTVLVLSPFRALSQSFVTVHDYYVLNPGSLGATSNVDRTFYMTGNGSVSGIESVTYQVVLPSFSISISRGSVPSNDSNGHWEVDSSTRYPATVTTSVTFNPDVTILNPSHPGSPVQHLSVTYDGAFKAGSFEVNVPDSGSYVFGTQSKVSISDQFVQAPGTSATIQYKDTLRGTIALASNLAVETTYRYVSTVPEPEAAGVAMAATTGVFMLLRRARRTGQGH